jgi:hypothetical protein
MMESSLVDADKICQSKDLVDPTYLQKLISEGGTYAIDRGDLENGSKRAG